ncbi:hypothetical protein TWF694_007468 [Orbilia ellipsospora]|uniref:Peptidase M43 pregnancy-associated plasma-A domain-containing protein n=1 Tax=Orbilia ellipsospora TaxID=2528407 RepID=A0AAV9XJB8_9PEZI
MRSFLTIIISLCFALAIEARFTVPVFAHVVIADQTRGGGNIPDAMVIAQMAVLNQAFARFGLSFRLQDIRRTLNPTWASAAENSQAAISMKNNLRVGGVETLNLYIRPLPDGLLGTGTFPADYARDPKVDGCEIHPETLPGGFQVNYNLGKIAVQQVGHWVGLYNTYEGGCSSPGDYVDDTPAQATPGYGCPIGRDSCPGGGPDPISNYMSGSFDICKLDFTNGQGNRMAQQLRQYRGINLF